VPKRVLLVDGYNVLRSGSRYRRYQLRADEQSPDHAHDPYNAAREALIGDVATFAGQDWQATLVFDGGGNPQSRGAVQQVAGLDLVFSAAGTQADTVIEELARKAAEAGSEVLVVTSDAALQWTVMGGKVSRMSAEGFCAEMAQISREVAQSVAQARLSKTTLGERLDANTRARLEQLARRR